MGTLCHSWGATGERVEQHVVHVCRKVIDCTRLALLGALSPRKRAHPRFALHARCHRPHPHCLPALVTTAKEEAIYPTRRPFFAAPRPVRRQVLTVVATRERLLGFEEPSGSGVVGGQSAHQGYLQ